MAISIHVEVADFCYRKFSSNENKSNKENKNRHLKDHSDYDFIQYIMQVSFGNLAWSVNSLIYVYIW